MKDSTRSAAARPHAKTHVCVLVPLGKGGHGGIDRIMDYVRVGLDNDEVDVRYLTTAGPHSPYSVPIYLPLTVLRLIWLKLTGRVDLIHVNLSTNGSTARKLVLMRLSRWLGVPYVIHLHGSRYRQYWDGLPPARSEKLRRAFEAAALVLVLGTVWYDYVRAKAPAAHTVVLPNATPAFACGGRKEKSPTAPILILFLGLIGPRKGAPELIAALGMLGRKADLPPWRAVIGGNGEVEAMAARAKELGVADRTGFPGWVGPDDVDRLLHEADILVLPSHDENLPMSVIEGMSAELAVVTTPVGAVEDIIINGKNGLLVPPGDEQALAAALERLVRNPDERRALAVNARAFHTEHLEITGYTKRLVELWKQAVGAT